MIKLRSLLAVILLIVVVAGGSVTYAVSPATQEDQTISVSGVLQFDTGSAHLPAEGLRVELRDDDPLIQGTGQLLAWTLTDEEGRYSFEDIPNRDITGTPPRWDGTGQDVRVVIETDNDHVAVESVGGRVYSWVSDDPELLGARGFERDVPDGANVDFGTILFREGITNFKAIAAFNSMNTGYSFVVDELGLSDPGFTRAWWPIRDRSERGYDPALQIVMLTTGDADFPDAVLHLQAHAFMHNMLLDMGETYPADCVSEEPIGVETSQQCAWVHGWGLYFAAAAQDDPLYVTATETLNIEVPQNELDDGDAVSARVAGALWDLADSVNEGFDQYTGSAEDIWSIFADAAPSTFPDFWAAWVDAGLPQCEPLTSLYQNTINYNTPPTLEPFPDPIVMDEDPEDPPAFFMPDRASDAECSFEKLLFDVQVEDAATGTVDVQLREDGYLEIIPAENWNGETTAEVRVFDGVDFTSQSLHIIVNPVNDPPTISPVPDRAVRIGEPIVYQLENSISDVDHPKASLTLDVVLMEQAGPDVDVQIDQENFIVNFVPQNNVFGRNTYEIRVSDPEGGVGRHTVFLTWDPLPNEAPTIDATIPLVWEAHRGQTIVMDLLTYATDDRDDPDELEWSVDPETVDHATWAEEGDPTHELIFTPDPATFEGDDDVSLIVQDTKGLTNTVDIILRWTPLPNIAPFINPPIPDFSTGINQQLRVDLSRYGHDQDDNDAGLRWYVQFADPDAPNPFVSGQGTQILTFTPVLDFQGTIEVLFRVRDPKGAEAEQLVNLTWQKYNIYLPLHMRPFGQKPTN